MAKPRKSKNEDHKGGCVVLHQKLYLSIDMEKKRIFGHTELKMLVPDGAYIALYADGMSIGSVAVDGEPAEYEHFPHFQTVGDDERRWCSVSSCNTAADAASAAYISSLEKEMAPNLLISCRNLKKSSSSEQGQEDNGNIVQNSSGEQVVNGNGYSNHSEDKNVKWVRIGYWIERAEAGVQFRGNVMHTNNQIRRARCWFPCVDNSSQRCTYDMEFTVSANFVAVSNGSLLYQVLSKDDPPRKTYVYKLTFPICAEWISLAVAPFEILPDSHSGTICHMCLSPNLSKLQNTVGFFHQAFSHYEDYLATSFPFGSYKQIFIPPEVLISSTSLGASMCIFSSHLLFDEKVIDQTIETRIKLAYALARQWFGIYIAAEDPADEWLIEGLAGFLTDSFIKKFLGNNEARYRRYKANCVVCKADISGATALSSSAASTELYGTQSIGLHGKIRSWKAVAVLQMLEKQMGPDSFRKILQNIVYKAFDLSRYRTLSTKEFNNLAYKVRNLERPFLKEFFPSWVESCGCPVLRMGLSYIKRKNMIEFAVMRGCTAKAGRISNGNTDNGSRDGDAGWPGMMSIRVHELDGMYDHPSLPLAGDTWQLLEIQCHSKLASKRIQKPKKGSKADGSDDNADAAQSLDMRSSMMITVEIPTQLSSGFPHWFSLLESSNLASSLMPSYNGILTISCIRTLAQIALKMSSSVPLERISELIKPFRSSEKSSWEVRIESSQVLLDLEFYCRGLNATLSLFMKFLEDEPSLRGETKLAVHVMLLCQVNVEESEVGNDVSCQTLVSLLGMLSGRKAFNNVFLRHQLYCILQIVAGRPPTLYGVPKIQEHMNTEAAVEAHSSEQPSVAPKIQEHMMVAPVEAVSEQQLKPAASFKLRISKPQDPPPPVPADNSNLLSLDAPPPPPPSIIVDAANAKEADTVSNCSERRKNILKIKVKQPGSSSKAEDADYSRGGQNEANNEVVGPASSVSVDAPNQDQEANEPLNVSHHQNTEEVNSCHDYELQMTTASVGSSAKLNTKDDDDSVRELQCTADSMKKSIIRERSENDGDGESVHHIQDQSTPEKYDVGDGGEGPRLIVVGDDEEVTGKRKKEKKRDKEKKRKREKDKSNDSEYLERKRQKKEKKRMETELAAKLKQQKATTDGMSSLDDYSIKMVAESSLQRGDPSSLDHEPKKLQGNMEGDHNSRLKMKETTSVPKLKIKIRSLSSGHGLLVK